MKIVHLLATGNNGGIERLIYDYSKNSKLENIFIFAWGSGQCGEKLKKRGKKVYDIDGHKIGNLNTIKLINCIIKDENPDFIIVHHASSLLRIISLFQPKEKVIIYQHNDPGNNFEDFYPKSLIKIIFSKIAFEHAGRVVAISKFVKSNLINYYKVNSDKISIIYNGTDVKEFYFNPHYYDGILHFVTVARLTEDKGIQNSIKMLMDLPKDINWDYTIIGDGEYKRQLLELKKYYHTDKINFLGNRDNISEILNSKDIFLHLCNCNEGFGITIIEAMSKGKICIVNNKGALPEIITNGIDGFVIDDEGEGIEDIKNIIYDSKKWNEIVQNARITANNYSISSYVDNLDNALIEYKKIEVNYE